MTQREKNGRGLFYSRDSGGKHEQTPSEYVRWAARKAEEFCVKFSGTPIGINEMIHSGEPVRGDLYFDYCVSGDELSRPALNRLREDIRRDQSITHVFIPRRDRLARPDNPINAIILEYDIREQGITIVYMKEVLEPRKKGQRIDISELLLAAVEFDQSGKFLDELASKMLSAQLGLAKQGYSTGGRAPFGFRRVLVRDDGTRVRQLADGERVRQPGHHVVWLPGPDHEIELILRILRMLETMPASRVARQLNEEGIPSPDAGRIRKDGGVRHRVSGLWHQTTIVAIARNKLLIALTTYGRRSMGKFRRMTAEGYRELVESDFRIDGKAKVIRNSDDALITVAARFDPVIALEQQQRLNQILDARAGTQRGKPRSRVPEQNPLGSRVFDLACKWPMYRIPHGESFRYKCGLYQQSHSRECRHNHIDGVIASRFALAASQQQLLKPGLMDRLEQKLRERLQTQAPQNGRDKEFSSKKGELATLLAKLKQVSENLALAATPEQYQAISTVFDDLNRRARLLTLEVDQIKQPDRQHCREEEVAGALRIAQQLTSLASDASNLGNLGRLFAALNVQLFLSFKPVQKKKRVEQKLSGGVLTFGTAPPPIQKYAGPTGRRAFAGAAPPRNAEISFSGEEEKSSGNVSRGDWI